MKKTGAIFIAKMGPHPFALAAAHAWEKLTVREWLDREERKLWNSFGSARRQEHFLLGRVAAKRALLALEKGHLPTKTALLPGHLGQPTWRDLSWRTSLTHSGSGEDSIAMAVTGAPTLPLALDLEALSPERNRLSLLRRRLPAAERFSTPNPMAAVIGVWSAKECLGKVLGTGIGVAPSVLALQRIHSTRRQSAYQFKAVPQFQVTQWERNGWLLSFLGPKGIEVPRGLPAWFQSVVR